MIIVYKYLITAQMHVLIHVFICFTLCRIMGTSSIYTVTPLIAPVAENVNFITQESTEEPTSTKLLGIFNTKIQEQWLETTIKTTIN